MQKNFIFRLSDDQHQALGKLAILRGFATMAQYLRWLISEDAQRYSDGGASPVDGLLSRLEEDDNDS